MAKADPSLTPLAMQIKLGYKVDSSNYPDKCFSLERFYSDLSPVPPDNYRRDLKEFEKHEKHCCQDGHAVSQETIPPIIKHGQGTISLTRNNHVVFYNFAVDVHYGFGFDLSLLLTSDEALEVWSVAQLQSITTDRVRSAFFELPKEIRDEIYLLVLPEAQWRGDTNVCDLFFLGGLGDDSGFYYPLRKDLGVLGVDRQMRQEALPQAYRCTTFHLDDVDDLVKLLLAVGKIGRDNIESLELTWQSGANFDMEREVPALEDLLSTLPTLHTERCAQLLKQCKRLRHLRLYFDIDLLTNVPPDQFKADPGVRGLTSIRGIREVQIGDLTDNLIEDLYLAKWLKGEMESAGKGRGSKAEPIIPSRNQ